MNIKCIAIFSLVFLFAINVKAQEITTFNGFWGPKYYQDDKKISGSEVETLMKTNPESHQLWQKSKTHLGIAYIAIGVQLGFLTWQLTGNKTRDEQIIPLVGNIAAGVVGIGFALSSNNKKKNAILTYNRGFDEVSTLHLGPTHNGYGFVYSF